MADMFGAPIGIHHAEADTRAQMLGGLEALKRIGDIEAQPVDVAYKKALTREHEATATAKEAEAGADRLLAQLASGGTVQDSPPMRLADVGIKMLPTYPKRAMEVLKTAAELNQKEEATRTQQERQKLMQIRTTAAQIKQRASFAMGALAGDSQAAYDAARIAAINAGEQRVLALPESYEDAKPFLKQFVAQGTDALKQLEFEQKQLVDKSTIARNNASAGRSAAAVKVLVQKERIARQDADEITKNGGKFSAGAIEARKASVDARTARTQVLEREAQRKELAAFPPVPDPSSWGDKVGKMFTWPNGAKVRIEKNPTTGKPEAVLVDMPKLLQPAAPRATSSGAIDNLENDEDDDE